MYLLDTDIIIFALRGNDRVATRLRENVRTPLFIAIPTLMELFHGAYKSKNRIKNLASVRTMAHDFNLIQPDEAIAETYGEVKAELEKKGTPLDDMDVMIAGTALSKNLILVTNNEKHFKRIKGLTLENWCK